ncbi:hypothetical protein M1N06_04600 [Peptococcaceae bacterium]|nr:hypothetical protein [Peptococcaceae bacterium]
MEALIASIILLFLIVPVAIVLHFLAAIGFYKLAKRGGISSAWLAFIPIAQYYTWGKLIKDQKFVREIYAFPFVFLLAIIILTVAAVMLETSAPLLANIINLASLVIMFFCLYLLYDKYAHEKTIKYTVISILTLGIAAPIIIFMIRNNRATTSENLGT